VDLRPEIGLTDLEVAGDGVGGHPHIDAVGNGFFVVVAGDPYEDIR